MTNSSFEFLTRPVTQLDHAVVAGTKVDSDQRVLLQDHQRAVHTYVVGVSGVGKSRQLLSLICQDIAKGRPVVVLDPMGDLFRGVREFVATAVERALDQGWAQEDLAQRFLFLDATDDENPIRINPLEPLGEETSEQLVDDLLKAMERLFGRSLEEMWKLRNVLRGAFLIIVELHRLRKELRPQLPARLEQSWPLTPAFALDILAMTDTERLSLIASLPRTTNTQFRERYWQFFSSNPPSQQTAIIQSSYNAIAYLLDDAMVARVLGHRRSTIHIPEMLKKGQSLIAHLPLGENLTGAQLLGRFLTTKLQHSCYRRPESQWQHTCSLYLDEFHQFCGDQSFADAMTNLRKYGLRVTLAHQSSSQPPFQTTEGQALLQTVKANAKLKIVFRLDRPDAEELSRELFEVSQQRVNFEATDHSVGRTQGETESLSRGTGESTGSTRNSSQGQTRGSGEREGGVRRSESHQNSSAHGSRSERSRTEQQTRGKTTGRSETETTRKVYYTLEGERELLTARLQRLECRQCYVFTAAHSAQLVETPFVPDQLYSYQTHDFPKALMRAQRHRLLRPITAIEDVPEEGTPSVVRFERPVAATVEPVHPVPELAEDELPEAFEAHGEGSPFLD